MKMAVSCSFSMTSIPTNVTATRNATTVLPTSKVAGFGHPISCSLSGTEHDVLIVIYSLIFIVGCIGNGFVCLVLGRTDQRRKGDIFIISLGITDLLACIVWPVHMIAYHSYHKHGFFFTWASQSIFYFLFYTSLMVSSWHQLLIAIDRYWAVTSLTRYRTVGHKQRLAAVTSTWILSALIKFPLTWRMDLFRYGDTEYHIYLMVWTLIGWVIPVIIVSFLYGAAIRALNQGKMKRVDDNARITKMFLIIVVLYFIFTIPHSICDLFRYIYNQANYIVVLHECLVILVLVNSCTNPFIYASMHCEVNRAVASIWKRIQSISMMSSRHTSFVVVSSQHETSESML